MTNQTLMLNLIPGGIEPVIHVSQYDKGQTWAFNLYAGSQAFSIPSGATVSIRGTKPDENGFAYDCTYSGNVVTAIEQQQMTAVDGKVKAEIVITKNTEMIGSANFVINVEKAALDSDTPISDTEIPAIIELAQEQAEDAEAWTKGTKNGQAVPSTAEQYHNNAKYWAEQASGSAADALKSEGYAVGKQNGTDVASDSPYYHNNSKYYSEQAASSASTASTKASQASTSATNAANSATSASGSATTATQKATAAANSATAAANSATAAQQAAASLTVDSALSSTSTNPVQNKIVKGEFDSVKQALTNEVIKRQRLNTKNLLPFNGIMTGNITATSAPPSGFLANITLKQGDEIVFTCNQDSALTSNTRNTLLIDPPNGTPQTRIYEDGAISTDYHNAAGLHIIRYTATEDGEYGFYLWTHTLSSAITYSKFMVCFASDYDVDPTYSYALPNSQLLSYKDNGVLGAKNIMPMSLGDIIAANAGGTWSGNAYTYNGITFTVNTDAKGNITSINVNGTSTANNIPLYLQTSFTLVEGKQYILSGCPSGGSASGYRLTQYGATFGTFSDTGSGVTFTCSANNTGKMLILIGTSGTVVSNKTFYPMIRLATDTDPTYQPYAMTNRELTDARFLNGTLGAIATDNFTSTAEYTIPADGWYHLYLQTNTATSTGSLSIMLKSDYVGNRIASHQNSGIAYERCSTNIPLKKGTKVIFKCTDTTTTCQYQAVPIT